MWRMISHYIERHYWLIMEGPRLGTQLMKTMFEYEKIEMVRPGNMTPTLFIPGFGASNVSTYFMRKVLGSKQHNPIKWCEPRNTGFNPLAVKNTIEQVKYIADSQMSKVNIVGQSLGGCYARMVANEIPDYVNCVITLGSPINGIDRIHPSSVEKYNTIVGLADAAFLHHTQYAHTFSKNPPVPTSSFYSKTDGVVEWCLSKIEEGPLSENIEVGGNHFGMGFDIPNIIIMADRLTQDAENWNKFKA